MNREGDRVRSREIKRSRTNQRLNAADEMELQAIQEEELELQVIQEEDLIGPYAIGEAEGNTRYLQPNESMQYSNVVPKTKTWKVGTGN